MPRAQRRTRSERSAAVGDRLSSAAWGNLRAAVGRVHACAPHQRVRERDKGTPSGRLIRLIPRSTLDEAVESRVVPARRPWTPRVILLENDWRQLFLKLNGFLFFGKYPDEPNFPFRIIQFVQDEVGSGGGST